jgi:hypothetical protein
MRHDRARLARKCREQGRETAGREVAALLHGMADGLDTLAGNLALIRRSAADPLVSGRRTPRSARRS